MTRFRQWVLVLGTVFLAGVGGFLSASPVAAQTPSNGQASASSMLGAPFASTFPYVGAVPYQTLFAPAPFPSSYSTLSSSQDIFPFSAYAMSPLTIASPVAFAPSAPATSARVVSSQTDGMYCTDKTGGTVWMPAGSPADPLLTCPASGGTSS